MGEKNAVTDVIKKEFQNGLKLLALPDSRGDVASVVHWVNVGYFNESDDRIGISHFLEHLFFKGSKTRKMEEISDEIKGLGGYLNAGTIYDHTYFYTVLPSANVKKGIEIISDLLMNPNFPEAEIETEKSVVIEEIKRKLDSPDQMGFEKLVEMAFDRHRIRRFRMGNEEDIRKLTREDIEKYYNDYYKPNNSILSIAGNFDPDEIVSTVENLYGAWKGSDVPSDRSPQEEGHQGPRYRKLYGDISQAYLKFGFHIPNILGEGFYPVNFTSALLGKGRSSRLYRTLKEDLQIVDDIGTSIYADREIGYLLIEATLKEENFARAEEAIAEELSKIINEAPSDAEMTKVRNIVETNYFSDKEDVLGQAYNLAYYESLGSFEMAKDVLKRLVSVGKEEITDWAGKCFNLNNLCLLEYVNGSRKEKNKVSSYKMKPSLVKPIARHLKKDFVENGTPGTAKPIPELDFPFNWLSSHSSFKPVIKRSDGKPDVIMKNNLGIPMLSSALYLPGGRLDENEKNCGITYLVLRSAIKGSKKFNAKEIAEKLEALGCSMRAEATADNFGYAFTSLSKNFYDAYSIITDILTEPTFDEAEIEKEKVSMKAAILMRRDDMFRFPVDLCHRALFGIHPYGLPRFGTEESIDSITRDEMIAWHKNFFDWSKMVICSVGEGEELSAEKITAPFAGREPERDRIAKILPLVVKRGVKEAVEKRKKNQTAFALSFQTPGMSNDDCYPFEVLQNILAGMGGRLYMEVREKKGLAYTITAFNISLLRTGTFVIYAATSPKNEDKTRKIILEEIEKLKKYGFSPDEVRRAKNYTIGSNNIAMQTNLAQVYEYLRHYFVKDELQEPDTFAQKINAVTEEDLGRILDKYFNLSNYSYGVVRGE